MLFNIQMVLIVMLMSMLHEMGHILSLCSFGCKPDSIKIAFYGIGLKHSVSLSRIKEFFFLISGISVNLVLYFLGVYKEINLALIVINSLPIYPLDGGRALKIILNSCFSIKSSKNVFRVIGIFTYLFLFSIAIKTKNVSLFLIAIYSIIYSVNNSID